MAEFATLLQEDTNYVVSRLPKDVRKLLQDNPDRLFLAGGFIRAVLAGEEPSDIDLLGPQGEDIKTLAERLERDRLKEGEKVRIISTRNAYTVLAPPRLPVQFIHRWQYTDPAVLLDEFDFTIARAVIWWEGVGDLGTWKSLCDPRYYADLAGRRLVYMAPQRAEDAGGSLLRVVKFLRRGYRISPENLARVIARVASGVRWGENQALFHDYQTLNQEEFSRVLAGLMRQIDPLTIRDGNEIVEEDAEGQV